MPRRRKCRRIGYLPETTCFKPEGKISEKEAAILLSLEELEAIRLKDYLGYEQEESARSMEVSRQTFQRILSTAHIKIADALINGKPIYIEGGNYCLDNGYCRREGRYLFGEICPVKRSEVEKMNNIAICSSGNKADAKIDGRFGRCAYFTIYNQDSKEYKFIENQGADSAHGAGTGAAQVLINQNVNAVIASRIGPKAIEILKKSGIKVYGLNEVVSVEEAVKKYLNKELQELQSANN